MAREWEVKKLIVEIGRRLWQRGYVAANDGNISVRLNDREILTTPTGVSKGFMNTAMILKVDENGNLLSRSSTYKPSSEIKMHLEVYRERADISAVVHAHPPYCTGFAVANIPLDRCILPEAIFTIGSVPVAEYGLPSSTEIPEKIRPYIQKSDAVLLQNHGALTLGSDLINAYYKMETLEHTAHIVWNAVQLGSVNVLPEEEAQRLMALREKYHVSGQVSACETEPLAIKDRKIETSAPPSGQAGVKDPDEALIKAITQEIMESLKKKNI